ncbi:uncharacterized protein LOC107815556 isoform X2 [Nicotiana tabacum]|uniref:Uncharacterized protein LOC107815556 isoform X2 n=1 Tax=Nicotiana tabacum TaxID=4097 RepID=A0AC58U4U6_TOBAC
MGDRVVVYMDRLVKPNGPEVTKNPEMVGPSSLMTVEEEGNEVANEEVPLIGRGECRICQEEDSLDKLESPCACSGSLKFAHRACVQHWCDEKGDITCEICHQQYQPGYTVPPRTVAEETIIDIGGGWQISGTPLDLHDPRLLAIAEAERQLLEDDYNSANASGAAFCRSAALILMALLLLRHALPMTDTDGDDEDPTAFFSVYGLCIPICFSCFGQLASFYPATSCSGPSAFCSSAGKERKQKHWQQHNLQLCYTRDSREVYSLR